MASFTFYAIVCFFYLGLMRVIRNCPRSIIKELNPANGEAPNPDPKILTLALTPDAPSIRGAICRRGSGAVVRHGGRAEGRPRLLNRHHHRLLRARSPDDPRVCAEGAAACSCREHTTAHAAGWPRWAEAQGGLQDSLALEACSGAARSR